MSNLEKIFNKTVGISYLNAYEQLLTMNQPNQLYLNNLQEKLYSRLQNYAKEVYLNWYENQPDDELIETVQFKEYTHEAQEYLLNQLRNFPKVYILWEMDLVIDEYLFKANNGGVK